MLLKCISTKLYIRISEVFFAISSSSFLFISKSDFNGRNSQRALAYMVGVLFWTGLTVGLLSMILLNSKRRKAKFQKYRCPGVIRFFSNKKAKICDVLMMFSLSLFLVIKYFNGLYHGFTLVLLALSVLLIYMHSILNGNNYAYAFQKGV